MQPSVVKDNVPVTPSKLPILTPPASSIRPLPQDWPRCLYTPDQLAHLDEFKTQLLPEILKAGGFGQKEELWCDDACLLRYLRATKWNVANAGKRLDSTLQWRRDYKPDEIPASDVEEEAIKGKEILSGFDKDGRPLLYLIPKREHTKTFDRQLKFVVWNVEKAIKVMQPGVESLIFIIDYEGISVRTSPPASQAKKFLSILGDHYPERLGKGFMINPSWYLWVFFKVIGPFMDPITRSKIHMVDLKKQAEYNSKSSSSLPGSTTSSSQDNVGKDEPQGGEGTWSNIRHYIDGPMLLREYGGEFDFEYDHPTYWSAVNEIK
ncbi:CRAL-TRIO domain-containing protein [Phlyctochytrium arcticum]|nr:CRAL-TRIO domain-containing protein [Phlyctochytrium arcticum]